MYWVLLEPLSGVEPLMLVGTKESFQMEASESAGEFNFSWIENETHVSLAA